MQRRRTHLLLVAALALLIGLAGAVSTASAAKPGGDHRKAGHGHKGGKHGHDGRHDRGRIADDEISIQLWNFAAYIGFGTDAATQARLEEVLRRLSEIGYRNVEPFSFNGLTAAQFKALLDRYRLRALAPRRRLDHQLRHDARRLEHCASATSAPAASRRRGSAATRARSRPRS